MENHYIVGMPDRASSDWLLNCSRRLGNLFSNSEYELIEPHFTLTHINGPIADSEALLDGLGDVVRDLEAFLVYCRRFFYFKGASSGKNGIGFMIIKTDILMNVVNRLEAYISNLGISAVYVPQWIPHLSLIRELSVREIDRQTKRRIRAEIKTIPIKISGLRLTGKEAEGIRIIREWSL